MQKLLDELQERLLRAGVASRHVRRYTGELASHIADVAAEERASGSTPQDAYAAALRRVGRVDELADAMFAQPSLRAWSVRMPWVFFSLAPLLLLIGAELFALLVLWTGWIVFLPDADVPFVRVRGIAIIYFGIGRLIYFAAPVLIGWWLAAVAIRQRMALVWPVIGSALLAAVASSLQVHAYRGGISGRSALVSLGMSAQALRDTSGLSHAMVIVCLACLPLTVWHSRRISVRA